MRSVPDAITRVPWRRRRDIKKLQTAWNVVFPAAFSGVSSSYILGISVCAVGETGQIAARDYRRDVRIAELMD
jgi:ABC-type phosphate transport system permease subunit